MKVFVWLTIVVIAPVVLAGCTDRQVQTVADGFAIGTTYHIVVLDDDEASWLKDGVDSVFALANSSMSLYNPNSVLSRVNRGDTDTADVHIIKCIEIARLVSGQSGGMYDVTVKPVSEALGFGAGTAVENPDIDSLLQYVGYEKLQTDGIRVIKSIPGVQIDLNSIAKGYTVDLMARMIESHGVRDYMVEIGGEIFCRGRSPQGRDWKIGVDKPFDGNFIPGADIQVALSLSDMGLATSGNYRNFHYDSAGNKVSHTINPKTGASEQTSILSATIIAPSCAEADAYASMMMCIGVKASVEFLCTRDDIMGYLVYTDAAKAYCTYLSPALEKHIAK